MQVAFQDFVLDRATRQLLRGGEQRHLEPKAFELLDLLVARRPHAVSKSEIQKVLWPDTFVSESSLTGLVGQVRQALVDDPRHPRFIRTVHGFGYAFSAAVSPSSGSDAPAAPRSAAAPVEPPTRTRGRWLRIAAVAAALVLAAAVVRLLPRSTPAGNRGTKSPTMLRLTADMGFTTQPTLSADAEILAYASDRSGDGNLDLWMQQVSGGEPVRLTSHPMDDEQPSLSPDGTRVAFRSARDGGGVYVMPARSRGEAVLMAPGGTYPRFSPDGRWIAYTIGMHPREGGDPEAPGLNSVHVVAASSGSARRIVPDFDSAFAAVWSPDGKRLLFRGKRRSDEPIDWWVVSTEGGAAVRTGVEAVLERTGIRGRWFAGAWLEGNRILMAARSGDVDDVWLLPLANDTFHAGQDPQRLTQGVASNLYPFAAANRLVFGGHSFEYDVWSLPVDTDRGTVTGEVQRITRPPLLHAAPSVSSDGKMLAYYTLQSGGGDLRTRSLEEGSEVVLVPPGRSSSYILHPDGDRIAYRRTTSDPPLLEAIATDGKGTPQRLCGGCGTGRLWDWSRDGRWVLDVGGETTPGPATIEAIDLASGQTTDVLRDDRRNLYQAGFSSDAAWVVFMEVTSLRASRLWLAPFRFERVPRDEWVALTTGGSYEDKPRWSPNAQVIYFVSNRDGHRCIWGQRLDSGSKRPAGAPFGIHHAHTARLSIGNVPMSAQETSVSRDRVVFNMGEVKANIWSVALDSARH